MSLRYITNLATAKLIIIINHVNFILKAKSSLWQIASPMGYWMEWGRPIEVQKKNVGPFLLAYARGLGRVVILKSSLVWTDDELGKDVARLGSLSINMNDTDTCVYMLIVHCRYNIYIYLCFSY